LLNDVQQLLTGQGQPGFALIHSLFFLRIECGAGFLGVLSVWPLMAEERKNGSEDLFLVG
jgi:hypothetical protein